MVKRESRMQKGRKMQNFFVNSFKWCGARPECQQEKFKISLGKFFRMEPDDPLGAWLHMIPDIN